ncbi:MAG: hypothetical protein OSB41_05265 [Kiritimatiellae bacterium]|nr:hypothetical protein [Kiritimatiellia bacterium]
MRRRTFISAAGAAAASTVLPKFAIAKSAASANSKVNETPTFHANLYAKRMQC